MINRLRALWNNVFRRKQLDRDLDEELQAYVELVSAEKLRVGVDPDEAHRDARRQAEESIRSYRMCAMFAWESGWTGSCRMFAMGLERSRKTRPFPS